MVASFGERLKKEREKRNMSLEDVASVTKISVRNLRALEQEKFDQMPGGIFNRGFVRSYAKHLGLDDEQVVADYMEAAGETLPFQNPPNAQPTPPNMLQSAHPGSLPAPPEPRSEGSADNTPSVPWAALAGLLLFGTVLIAAWFYHSHRQPPEGPPTTQASSAPAASQTTTPPSGSSEPAQTSAAAPSSTTPAPATPPAGGFDVTLRARDEVWLSSAVDGQPPSESTLEDGQSMVVHASNRAILKLGNAAALDVAFNGQKVPLHASEGQVRTLTFTPSGLQAPPAPN